jgi:hypothetical protein
MIGPVAGERRRAPLRWSRRRRSAAAAGIFVAAVAAVAAVGGSADAAPVPFTLTLDGSHLPDATLFSGVRHEGPFTSSAPFCPAGFAADVKDVSDEPGVGLIVLRRFTCADGTGSVTV